MINIFKKKNEKEKIEELIPGKIVEQNENSDAEIAAAISVALSMHLQTVHDFENMILTFQKVVRPYSPWSSKIHGLRQIPRR